MTAPEPWAHVAAQLAAGHTVGERILAWPREDRAARTVWVFGPGVYAGMFLRPGARPVYGPRDLLEPDLRSAAERLRASDDPQRQAQQRADRAKDGDSRAEIAAWTRGQARERARSWEERVVESALWWAWWTSLYPRLDLDDGQVAWGCVQCAWGPLDDARAAFAGFRVVTVPVPPPPPPPALPRGRAWPAGTDG